MQDEASAHAARVHEAKQGVEAASAQASCSAQASSLMPFEQHRCCMTLWEVSALVTASKNLSQ